MRQPITLLLALVLGTFALAGYSSDLIETLNDPKRADNDKARDLRSRPEVIIPLLNLQAGSQVADIFAGGGYYSNLLSSAVGKKGRVLLHNNAAYKGFAAKGLEQRFGNGKPRNLKFHDAEVDNLKLGSGKLDAAMMIMSYHDLYFVNEKDGWPAVESADFLGQVYEALKPGGRFLIVDHAAAAGADKSTAQTVHRIDPGFARHDIEQYGFELVATSDVLRNPDDDYSVNVFDPSVRGKTDRFVMVFAKPIR